MSGDLRRVVSESTTYTAQNVGRHLRELANNGLLVYIQYRKVMRTIAIVESKAKARQNVERLS
jgi:hypothetical protein